METDNSVLTKFKVSQKPTKNRTWSLFQLEGKAKRVPIAMLKQNLMQSKSFILFRLHQTYLKSIRLVEHDCVVAIIR